MGDENFRAAPVWRTTAIACVTVFLGLLALFHTTAREMVYIWYNFETYTHGFIILPISLWLIWQKRSHLAAFTPQPTPSLLILVAGSLAVWTLARLVGVQILEQMAFVATIVGALAGILGWQVSKFLAFPLLFLFFAVPMGEDLVPPLMEFTADFTVGALRLTGVPVYREGLWFSLPSGNWSVVEACSGSRYLLASVTLGVMYAYITYHTLWKRLLFIVLSAVVPIIANGVRAYMIVMIGHLSEMEYATGVDHLLYGWVFFGLVMFILFWIGSFWQEEQEPPRLVAPPQDMSDSSAGIRVSVVGLIALIAAASTVWGTHRAETIEAAVAADLRPPAQAGDWRLVDAPTAWSADHLATPHTIAARYSDGQDEVQLFVVLFPQQRQGREAISGANRISADLDKEIVRRGGDLMIHGRSFRVNASKVTVPVVERQQAHLVWQWYRVAGRNLTNRYAGKAWEAWARIFPGRADGAWVAVTTPFDGDNGDAAEARLSRFAHSIAPVVDASIDTVLGLDD